MEIKLMNDTKNLTEDREKMLKAALEGREQEIMHYQINIDNYTIALDEISNLPDDERLELAVFAEQLTGLLASEKLEQKKSKIMLNVIKRQLL